MPVKATFKGLGLVGRWTGQSVLLIGWLIFKGAPRAWRWMRGQKAAPTHGSAGFAPLKELQKDGHLTAGGFLYGVQEKRRVFGKPEACTHFFAKRGEGKSQTIAANLNYLTELKGSARPDFLINDPTMEHFNALWPRLEAAGWELLMLNLDDPMASRSGLANQTHYNPLAYLTNSTTYTQGRDLESIASLLVPEFDEGKDSRHFLDAAHGVVVALMDWEVQNKGSAATLAEPLRLLTTAPESERDKVFAKIQASGSETAKAGINVFTRVKEREQGSFNSTIGRKLRVYNDKALADIMKVQGSPWCWEDVFNHQKPVAVFIVGGLGFETVSGPFTRLVIGQAIDSVRRYHNQNHKPLRKPLRVFIDEADTLGYCKPVQDAVTQLRKANVNVFMCWQSISQISANYKNSQPLIDGCDWIVTGGLKDEKLLATIRKLMGDFTAQSKSESSADHGKSQGLHETARPLMKEEEIKSLPWGKAIVLADRRNLKVDLPFKIEKGAVRYL